MWAFVEIDGFCENASITAILIALDLVFPAEWSVRDLAKSGRCLDGDCRCGIGNDRLGGVEGD